MPYAAKATIEHEYVSDYLKLWVTFDHPMRRYTEPLASPPVADVYPPLSLWLIEADGTAVDTISSVWQDEFTLLLTSDTVATRPAEVYLEYDGPDSDLETTWLKNWEPFGPILSTDLTATLWLTGMIILWSGAAAAIPSGWHLCDGTNGTPNLQDKFIVGAGSTYAVGATGGATTHGHTATQPSHKHALGGGSGIGFALGVVPFTSDVTPAITVQSGNNLPPYYALCYIMKL